MLSFIEWIKLEGMDLGMLGKNLSDNLGKIVNQVVDQKVQSFTQGKPQIGAPKPPGATTPNDPKASAKIVKPEEVKKMVVSALGDIMKNKGQQAPVKQAPGQPGQPDVQSMIQSMSR